MEEEAHYPHVINLANSIVGVGVLALPYTFQQCGLVLGAFLLLGSVLLTNTSCWLLMRAAINSKTPSYEYLAHHVFGPSGKLFVEILIIVQLLGACTAFHVIIGDLGPTIISSLTGAENTPTLRIVVMIFCATVALFLGLLRNVKSLSSLSAASMVFYCLLVLNMVRYAWPRFWTFAWYDEGPLWRTEGVFKCVAIFSLGLACQTSLFVVYNAMHAPNLVRMNRATNDAIGLCCAIYMSVGFLGFVAYGGENIKGDMLLHFPSTFVGEMLKLFFVLSIAISFPLAIFPCRTAVFTLMFAKGHSSDLSGGLYIPELHFKAITVTIVGVTLVIGILVPKVEFILALNGAVAGSLTCYVLPALAYLFTFNASEAQGRNKAKGVLCLGLLILVASTLSTLASSSPEEHLTAPPPAVVRQVGGVDLPPVVKLPDLPPPKDPAVEEKRHEPPVPFEVEKHAVEETKEQPEKPVVAATPLPVRAKEAGKEEAGGGGEKKDEMLVNELRKQERGAEKLVQKLAEQQERQEHLIQQQQQIIQELQEHREQDLKHEGDQEEKDKPVEQGGAKAVGDKDKVKLKPRVPEVERKDAADGGVKDTGARKVEEQNKRVDEKHEKDTKVDAGARKDDRVESRESHRVVGDKRVDPADKRVDAAERVQPADKRVVNPGEQKLGRAHEGAVHKRSAEELQPEYKVDNNPIKPPVEKHEQSLGEGKVDGGIKKPEVKPDETKDDIQVKQGEVKREKEDSIGDGVALDQGDTMKEEVAKVEEGKKEGEKLAEGRRAETGLRRLLSRTLVT